MSSLLGMESKETVDLWRLGAGLSCLMISTIKGGALSFLKALAHQDLGGWIDVFTTGTCADGKYC